MSNEVKFPYLYAKYTMTWYDYISEYPNNVEDLQLDNALRSISFWLKFNMYWGEYEINGETIELFEMRLKNKFNLIKDIWLNKIKSYENNYTEEMLNGIVEQIKEINNDTEETSGNNNTDYIDLPNKTASSEYISNKTKNAINSNTTNTRNKTIERLGNVNKIEQFNKYMDNMKDIYIDFVKEFKDCFIQLFD